jgi:hypothetical protein
MTALLDGPAAAARGGPGPIPGPTDPLPPATPETTPPLSDGGEGPTDAQREEARRLRRDAAAVRLSFRWFGTRRTLSPEQRQRAAEAFEAEGAYLSAGKKLLDSSHPQFRAVTAVRTAILSHWRGMSLPYPEPGIRLLRREDIPAFDGAMRRHRGDLAAAVAALDRAYGELKEAARRRLGRLFCEADYPDSLSPLFSVEWDFPSVEPPDYLRRVSPGLYEEERRRVAARFDEAVRLAEEAFRSEFAALVGRLAERLSGDADGKPRVFRDTAVTNLQEFLSRFASLGLRSDAQLEELVERARRLVAGQAPGAVRTDAELRASIASGLASVASSLEALAVERPRRNILRGGAGKGGGRDAAL